MISQKVDLWRPVRGFEELKVGIKIKSNANGAGQDSNWYTGRIYYISPISINEYNGIGECHVDIERDDNSRGGGMDDRWQTTFAMSRLASYMIEEIQTEWDN